MANPTEITVTGTFKKRETGAPASGNVTFRATSWLRNPGDNEFIVPGQEVATLDGAGQISIALFSTNDPDWSPLDWAWEVTAVVEGSTLTGSLQLAYNGPASVDLADVLTVPPAPDPPQAYVLVASVGTVGGPAGPLDGSGLIPVGQIPAAGGGIPASVVDAKGDLIAATAADTVARLPAGSNGEVLKANSATSTGLEWAAESGGGGGIPATIVDAVGDLIVGTAADTVARKAKGADGTALFVDSAQSDDLVWRAIAEADVTGLTAALAGKQPLDGDLTTIAGLTPTNNDFMVREAGAWANRTPAQAKTHLGLVKADVGLGNVDNTSDAAKPVSTATQTALDGKQPLDGDLTAIAALTPTNDDVIQRKAGAWTNRTPAQLKTDLAVTAADVGAVPTARTVTGTGNLTGGGDLTANRTLDMANMAANSLKGNNTGGSAAASDLTVTQVLTMLNIRLTEVWSFSGTAVASTVGVFKWVNRTGRTVTVHGSWVAAGTAPTGAAITVDVNKNGSTAYATGKPTLAAGSTVGALVAPPSAVTLADGDYLTVDIDSVGSTVAGADVTVGVVYN